MKSTVAGMGYPEVEFDVTEPPRREFGDLTCNVAFQLARHAKKPPVAISRELTAAMLPQLREQAGYIRSAEAHPAGYVNFTANHSVLSRETLGRVLGDPEEYGYLKSGAAVSIFVEHTSVNPNKALHVGHTRNVIIGDALFRLLKSTGHQATVLNYVDDSGLQVADIVIGFKYVGFPLDPPGGKKFDQYCGDDVYVKVNEMYEKDSALAEKRKHVLREIEEGKSEVAMFASELTRRVLSEQLRTCWRMKARYDLLNFESHIVGSKLWAESFELLKKHGIARYETEGKNKGCWVIAVKGEEDKVIVRSDGTATYVAKDIPYAAWKLGLVRDPFAYVKFATQWDGTELYATALDGQSSGHLDGAKKVITVIDSRQARLQRIISQVISTIGKDDNAREYRHLGYEAVTLSSDTAKTLGIDIGDRDFMHMSGRKGIYVSADYVMDTLHSKAYEEVRTRNPEFDEQQLHSTAEEIAISALRYNMLKQDLDKIIAFDINESLSLEGDTGPYLQYAFARSQRILEKSGEHVGSDAKFEMLSHEAEVALIKEISRLDLVVEDAAASLSPKTLARYAYSLATTFNLFYEKVPVLREQSVEVRGARLALVKAFGIALRNALQVLGISALDRM